MVVVWWWCGGVVVWWCGGVVVVWWFGVVVVCFILPITEAPQLTMVTLYWTGFHKTWWWWWWWWGVVYQAIIVPPQLTLFNSVLDWVVAICLSFICVYRIYFQSVFITRLFYLLQMLFLLVKI